MPQSVFHSPFSQTIEHKAFDMHVHTSSSDGLSSAKTVAKYVEKAHMGVAVTDHNCISGVRTAQEFCSSVVPALEVSAAEGPHLLVFFSSFRDLVWYYERDVKEYLGKCPHMALSKRSEDIIREAQDAGGFVVAAHPYGYGVSVRGVMKGIAAGLTPPQTANELDGLEVICSGLSAKQNFRAEEYARSHSLAMTGGSDAHVLWEVGRAVTAGWQNETPQEFLERVRQKKADVYGVGRTPAQNILMGACMTPEYIPYLVPAAVIQVQQNLLRLRH